MRWGITFYVQWIGGLSIKFKVLILLAPRGGFMYNGKVGESSNLKFFLDIVSVTSWPPRVSTKKMADSN